jgi:hypothetical protein
VSEFNEFKPRLKSPKNQFQLSAGLNLEECNTILGGTLSRTLHQHIAHQGQLIFSFSGETI